MVPYVVRAGDHLDRLAHRYRFDAAKVWNDPKNAKLKEKRGAGNVLAVGDILYIPDPTESTQWLPVQPGQKNSFVATVPTTVVKLRPMFNGQPAANADYRVQCGGTEQQGTTDGDGNLSFQAPLTAWTAVLVVAGKPKMPVRIGHLDPVDTDSGVVQRLRHLRYLPHAGVHGDDDTPSDWLDGALGSAIGEFQKASGLQASGTMDDDTRKALVAAHGC